MKKITTCTTIFLAALLLTLACKKEKPELGVSNHDPCGCASEVSAEFDIFDFAFSMGNWIRIPTDTVFFGTVGFEAKDLTAQEYTWYIGNQVFQGPSASRNFQQQWIGYDIPITLVIRKTPNNVCFPNDDGYDSIVKFFHIAPSPIYDEPIITGTTYFRNIQFPSLEGTYRLIAPHLADSIEITFDVVIRNGNEDLQIDIYSDNDLGLNCNSEMGRYISWYNYRFIQFNLGMGIDAVNPCGNWGGIIHKRIDGVAEISLRHKIINLGAPSTVNWYYFKGRKID